METILNEINEAIMRCPDPDAFRAEIVRIYKRHREELDYCTAGVPLFERI